jgi:hypothetical protein
MSDKNHRRLLWVLFRLMKLRGVDVDWWAWCRTPMPCGFPRWFQYREAILLILTPKWFWKRIFAMNGME